jgi:hypothetical protein
MVNHVDNITDTGNQLLVGLSFGLTYTSVISLFVIYTQ